MTTTFHSETRHSHGGHHQPRPRIRLGERQTSAWIEYGRPDVSGSQMRRYKRARIAVVGDNENVHRVLSDLDLLARQKPGTTITHVTPRRLHTADVATAPTPGRVEGFRVHGFYPTEGGVMLEGDDGRWIGPFDRLIVDDLHDSP
jgi:hypothetical protein